MAVLQVGALFVPVHHETAELDYYTSNSKPRLIVLEDSKASHVKSAPAMVVGNAAMGRLAEDAVSRKRLQIVTINLMQNVSDTIDRSQPIAIVCYTSGTTGRPKGAMVTHNNLITNAHALVEHWRMTKEVMFFFVPSLLYKIIHLQDRLLHMLPLNHIHGLCIALNTALICGAQLHVMRKFDAHRAAKQLRACTVRTCSEEFDKQKNGAAVDGRANILRTPTACA